MLYDKSLIIWSIIGTGISSVTIQLITIREFLSQFHGNEITISLVLFCWLLLTGLGSLSAKAVKRASIGLYTLLILVISMAPLIQILIIRGFREVLFTHGASPGFYPIFFYIMLTITPYCLLTGFVLPYSLKVLNALGYSFSSGELYLTDSIGDISGGALFSFVLVYWLKPFQTIAVTSALLILVGLLLLLKSRRRFLLVTAVAICSVFYYCATNSLFEKLTLSKQYGDVVQYIESPYGRIVISREGAQKTVWESGVPIYSGPNITKNEEKIHYPLCQLERVENVLLVSGGLGETLTEVAKYGPAHVDYVELDPWLTDAAISAGMITKAPTLDIKNTDGRHYLKTAQRSYDAIVIDLPDPDTFQINRFFTSEFISLAKGRLKGDGILSMAMEYSPNYISDIRKKKLSTLYNTARLHFERVMILPGEDAYFLMRDGDLYEDIPARLKIRDVQTSYIEGFYYGNVTKERIRQLDEIIDRNEYINTDFEPRLMNIVFQEWFMKHGASPNYFLTIFFVLTLIYLIFMRREEYILFSTGLVTMGAEMLIIFAFQVIYGYIYLKIGAIVTAFLLGLLPGSFMGNLSGSKNVRKLVLSETFMLAMLLVFFIWVTYLRSELHPMYFLAYCFMFSFLCGFQFPVAAGIIGEKSSPAAGCLAADLCGASVGTLATGTILIPLWGIQSAVIFLIFVKISSSVLIMAGKRGRT